MKKAACGLVGGNCWNCNYSYYCDIWNDAGTEPEYIEAASMALCKGRHEIPEAMDGAIFEKAVNPLDVDGLEEEALARLSALEINFLDLYVTGLTVALIAALNAAKKLNIAVTLYHYDRESGKYYPQGVR